MTVAEPITLNQESENQELARALRRRDTEVLDRLIERYQYRLLRYLTTLTRDRPTAEDLFQETWIRVVERGGQYNGRHRFEAWLFAIARNLAIDRIRQQKVSIGWDEWADEVSGEKSIPTAARTAAPLEDFMQNEQRTHIQQALNELPAGYREVLVLRFLEELALEEISGVIHAPLSTVKSRIYRGLDLLREKMEGAVL